MSRRAETSTAQKVAIFFIVTVLTVLTVSITIMEYWYYNTVNMQKKYLKEIVDSRKYTIKSLVSQKVIPTDATPKGISDKIKEDFSKNQSFSEGVTFSLILEHDKKYHFMYRSISNEKDKNVKNLRKKGVIQYASNNLSGTTVTTCIDGTKNLVAYDSIKINDSRVIMVAKMNYQNIIRPKVVPAILTGIIIVIGLLTIGLVFYKYTMENVKRLKEADQELEMFGQIISSAKEMMGYIDKDYKYIAVNQMFLSMFNIDKEDVIGVNAYDLHPDDQEYQRFMREALPKAFRGEAESYYRWKNFEKEGRLYLEVNMIPYLIDDEVQGIIITATNITKLEDARQALMDKTFELKDMTIELEERVKKEIEKRIQNEQLLFEQKKFADMGQMINAIAHQWRQPINSIGLYNQLMYQSVKDGSINDEFLEEFKDDSVKIVQHMSKTIDDFRSFFNPRTDETKFEVIKAVTETISLVDAQIKSSDITLTVSCKCQNKNFEVCDNIVYPPCKHPETLVYGYISEFKQVMMNVIQNAKDAVLFRDKDRKIDIAIESKARIITVKVKDNGGGIPNEVIQKIFDPYFTTKSEGKGTGIGLYMSKLIIEEHMNGSIMAKNNDYGATMTISLKKA